MQYKHLFFDMDNTLFDCDADEDQALERLFNAQDIDLTSDIKTTYQTFNQGLWRQYEQGELTREILLNTRFATFFKKQYQRLQDSGLAHYFDAIFVSEELGYQKPDPAYFQTVFQKLETVPMTQSLIVGDSLTSDVQGGQNVGVATAWYNPTGQINHDRALQPTHEIKQLTELLTL